LRLAIDLRERLPKVGALFAGGAIDYRMVTTLVNRADLVTDPERLARLDEAFARWAPTWMKLSGPKLHERVDMWVERFDPTGVREPKTPSEDVYVEVGPISPGVVGIWARLAYQDGVAFDTRLDAMASGVCRDDPRSKDQRRADALMAMASGRTRLACRCGAADCPHRGPETPAPRVVINVIAEQATLEGRSNDPGYLPGYGDALDDAEVAALRLRCVDGDHDFELRCLRAGYIAALGQITGDEDMTSAAAALAIREGRERPFAGLTIPAVWSVAGPFVRRHGMDVAPDTLAALLRAELVRVDSLMVWPDADVGAA